LVPVHVGDIRKEYSGNIMYSCMEMETWDIETITGKGGIKENDGGVNSTMTYCKSFCKCHNVPLLQQ
jgi:hypothetical protein